MSTFETNVSLGTPRLALWEKLIAWTVLIFVFANYTFLAFVTLKNWTLVRDGIASGAISWFAFVLPLLALVGAVLLVRMSTWCLPVFATHFVLSFLFIWYSYGLADMHWSIPFGYVGEILVLIFCLHLRKKGALRRPKGIGQQLHQFVLTLRSRWTP